MENQQIEGGDEPTERYCELLKQMYTRMQVENSWPWAGDTKQLGDY